jgi:multidrug efflux pump
VPLVVASGAGAEMRRSLGIAVFSGMLGVTLFGIFLTPVFFHVIEGFKETRLLASAGVRWVGSLLLGGLVGLALGFFLARVSVVPLGWALTIGGCLGVVAASVVLSLPQVLWRRLNGERERPGPEGPG